MHIFHKLKHSPILFNNSHFRKEGERVFVKSSVLQAPLRAPTELCCLVAACTGAASRQLSFRELRSAAMQCNAMQCNEIALYCNLIHRVLSYPAVKRVD